MGEQVNIRELALSVLLSVTRDGEMSHLVMRGVLDKHAYLPHRDRAFFLRLTAGTIERMIELDAILDCFSKTPVRKMKPVILNILRLAVYQIKYMDAVPDHAAVNEAVRMTGRHGMRGLTGFVNGVLRAVSRGLPEWTPPDRDSSPGGYFSVQYSMPGWIVTRFLRRYGEQKTEEILESYLAERPLTIRVNTDKTTAGEQKQRMESAGIRVLPFQPEEDADEEERRLSEYVFFLTGYDSVSAIPGFDEGLFYIQDLSSMQVAETAPVFPGMRVLDVCAAPGGKSLHLFSRMKGACSLEMRDLTEEKIDLIRSNIERMYPAETGRRLTVKRWNAAERDPSMHESVDLVIADLPCSGLGVIGRKAEMKYRVSEAQIRELSLLQKQILSMVSDYVKPGGNLIYSTCTLTGEENEEQVSEFLKEHPEYVCKREKHLLPDGMRDGFYIAVLEKKQEAGG